MGNFGIKNIWDIQTGSGNVNTDNLVTTNTTQTISAVKTFSALPQSSVAPTNANDLTNKNYVNSVAGDKWYKLGYINNSVVQPNQTENQQIFNISGYDVSNGMFSFVIKMGFAGKDGAISFYGIPIPNGAYSVVTHSVYYQDINGTDNGCYIKLERVNGSQLKLWFHNKTGSGFTVSYWGLYVKREGDLIPLI